MDVEASFRLALEPLTKEVSDLRADQAAANALVQGFIRGQKFIRLPIAYGTPASNAVSFGGATNVVGGGGPASPDQGFLWSVRLLVINGMTASASPDTIDIKVNNLRVWQLNGNQFAQTFGRGEMILWPGEAFQYVSNGAFQATGTITALGLAEEVPAEMMGKVW